ncbi:netrin receptor UNC5A-like [Mytilus edulis]|uniref:netrin receptor UNC5A-like n=1 Tax=Mytilus edulis TaxID=6550 RepID=UPI0039EF9E70
MRLDILFLITLSTCTVVNSFCIGTQTYLCTQRSSSYVYYTTACGFFNLERCGRSRKYYDHSYKRCTRSCPPVDGKWGSWTSSSSWSKCTNSCGSGNQVRKRTRSCDNPEPYNGGRQCYGLKTGVENRYCHHNPCPVDGDLRDNSQWSPWDTCNATCGGGIYSRYRNRTCKNPDLIYGVMNCSGSNTERQKSTCNTQGCKASVLNYVIIPGTVFPLMVVIIVYVVVWKKKRNRTSVTTHCIQNFAYLKPGKDKATSEDNKHSRKLEEKQITDGNIENLYLNTNNNLNCSSDNDPGDNTYDYAEEEEDHFDKNVDDNVFMKKLL